MQALTRTLAAVIVTSFVAGMTAGVFAQAAPSQNVKTIAGILAGLNHFASDADKKTLQVIVVATDATAAEKALAQALINVQHTANAEDKAKLEALAKDASAPEAVRTLAATIAGLNHTASAEQKAALAKIAAS